MTVGEEYVDVADAGCHLACILWIYGWNKVEANATGVDRSQMLPLYMFAWVNTTGDDDVADYGKTENLVAGEGWVVGKPPPQCFSGRD